MRLPNCRFCLLQTGGSVISETATVDDVIAGSVSIKLAVLSAFSKTATVDMIAGSVSSKLAVLSPAKSLL